MMMSFGEAIAVCMRKYATFSGRARRPEFWFFQLALILGSLLTGAFDWLVLGFGLEQDFSPVNTVFSLATLVPALAVTWRRLHDTGRPGYYYFIWIGALIPAGVLFYLGAESGDSGLVFFIIGAVIFIVALILLIVWLASRSQKGANAYGPEPGTEVDVEGVFD